MIVQVADFLRAVLGDGSETGWIETRAIPEPKAEGLYTRAEFWRKPEQAAAWMAQRGAALNSTSHGLFFGVARRARRPKESWRGGTNDDVDTACVLWADLDWKGYARGMPEAGERLKECRPAPSIIVCSGGGYHAYWCLRRPIPAAVVRGYNRRLVLLLGSDRTVVNPGRVLRLPGAWHRKNPEKIRPVSVVSWNPDLTYEENAFLGLPKEQERRKHPTIQLSSLAAGALRRGSPASRYAHGALVRTCDRLASAPDGQKHRMLFLAAIRMGQFVGVGLLFGADVCEWLLGAISRAGAKDLTLARKTIEDGITRGMRESPELPQDLLDR